ncbi:putative signal transducing protein [Rheinheimera sp. NSM]|uniref:putative signal transducing protein n=1 Tax=Rheinheimera sp. NSM TaxID=3457884 RepID=UPI004035B1C9
MELLHPADVQQWLRLYQAANTFEAGLVQGLLQQAAVTVRLSGEYLAGAAGELPLNDVGVQLWVPQQQFATAQRIISRYLQQLQHEPAQWLCSCGELNYQSFDMCWSCLQDKDETKSQ